MSRDISSERARRILVQQLESLQRAGLTHLPKAKGSLSWGEGSVGGAGQPVRSEEPTRTAPVSASPETGAPQAESADAEDRQSALDKLAAQVARCRRCPELVRNRTQTVFGVGNPYAQLVFIGEAPGADEDRLGEPFVGAAGQLLTDMIEKGIGLRRADVYIMNILRCRPPGNRTPLPEEAENCRPFLEKQLAIVRPKFICCLGACAAQNLLNTSEPIGRLRGKVHSYRGIRVVCTYHPAYLLRTPTAKRQTWEDLKLLMSLMGLPIPEQTRTKKTHRPDVE